MRPIRVLLVDDELELVSTIAERLDLRGFEAEWETSVDKTMQRTDICTFDIAILDIKMPKISGLALKEKLEAKCPHMKFIFLTGHGSGADFEKGAAAAGEMFYLVKPIHIDVLVDKIQKALSDQGGKV